MRFIDNGVGMTADEVEKYIAQVAFSGAEEFLKKYQSDKEDGKAASSATSAWASIRRSWSPKKVRHRHAELAGGRAGRCAGISEDGMEYDMERLRPRTTRGTTITLYLNDEDKPNSCEPGPLARGAGKVLRVHARANTAQRDRRDRGSRGRGAGRGAQGWRGGQAARA